MSRLLVADSHEMPRLHAFVMFKHIIELSFLIKVQKVRKPMRHISIYIVSDTDNTHSNKVRKAILSILFRFIP